MGVARRRFLQGSSQLLALLAASEWWGQRSAPAQAAELDGLGRKLALLIGINRYPAGAFLRGCLTDVDRQYELLVSRFGFSPEDIVVLTDGAATRERILAEFRDRLGGTGPSDRVLVHFSGFGRQVRVGDGEATYESVLTASNNGRDLGGCDLLVSTLRGLMRSLATPNAALVLDTSFGGSTRPLLGNLRSRTFPSNALEDIGSGERLNQENWVAQVTGDRDVGLPGELLLQATGPDRPAAEGDWGGFNTGLFTYALTQTLWQTVPPRRIWVDLALSGQQTAALTAGRQQPQLQLPATDIPVSYAGEPVLPPASGRVTAIDRDGAVVIRLTSVPLAVLRGYALNSRLVTTDPARPATLQIVAREGLVVRTKVVLGEVPSIGQTVRESIRVLPYSPGLTVALDASFDRIERVDATSAFANVSGISTPTTAGEGAVDCVFGRGPNGGYNLQHLDGTPIPATLGPSNEAVKLAVGRLAGYFNALLAAKLWRMLANAGATQLPLSVSLETSYPHPRVLLNQDTTNAPDPDPEEICGLPEAVAGTEIQFRLENKGDRPLYFVILGLDAAGNPVAFYPPFPAEPLLPARGTRVVPEPTASYDWIVAGPSGLAEAYAFFSPAPLRGTWEALSRSQNTRGEGERIVNLTAPLTVARALQEDLRTASAVSGELFGYDPAVYALDVGCWAALSFAYQVRVG